jgi:hypothetical protein
MRVRVAGRARDRLGVSVILVFKDRLVTDALVRLGRGGGLTLRLAVASSRLTCTGSVARRRPRSASVT